MFRLSLLALLTLTFLCQDADARGLRGKRHRCHGRGTAASAGVSGCSGGSCRAR